jgi:hypothetical protein
MTIGAKMKTNAFAKEAAELNELALTRETSYREFCLRLAALQNKVIDAGIVFKWWARDHLVNPRTNQAWADGTLHAHVQLGRKSDEEWQTIRRRKINSRGRMSLSGIGHRAVNEQVDVLMIAWEQISDEARRIFLDQIKPSGRRAA